MENGHFRHVSVGALLLAACALLAAFVSAASVVASDLGDKAARNQAANNHAGWTHAASELRIHAQWPDHLTVLAAQTQAPARLLSAGAVPVD